MRKRLSIVYCLLSIVYSLSAKQFKAGVTAGIASSQVDGDTYAGYNKAGIFAGAYVTKRLAPESKWSASFEITYIQKGKRW